MAPKVKSTELVVPYVHVPVTRRTDASGMISQTLPMAAMFLRNKMLSWSALFLAVQAYLNEPLHKQESEDSVSQPASLKVLFAVISLVTCYIELVFPNSAPAIKSKATQVASEVASEITSTVLNTAASSIS